MDVTLTRVNAVLVNTISQLRHDDNCTFPDVELRPPGVTLDPSALLGVQHVPSVVISFV